MKGSQGKAGRGGPLGSNVYDSNPSLWSVVAFQDEITRSLNLADPPPVVAAKPKKPIPRVLPPLNTHASTGMLLSSRRDSPHSGHTLMHSRSQPNYTYPHTSYKTPSPNISPPSTNYHIRPPSTASPPPPPTPLSMKSKPAPPRSPPLRPVSRRSPPTAPPPAPFAKTKALQGIGKEKQKEADIVALDQQKYNLTLAQKMGLSPAPAPPLSMNQWEEVKKISDSRQDSSMPCAICREEFRSDSQVLLSCSHVFHKICLDSFEKYSKTKACPLCRKEEYQKAQITEGKRVYMTKCAIKIQAVFRGYRARKMFRQIMDSTPPEDPSKRKVFFARKLERLTDQLLRKLDEDRAMIDSSMSAMNLSVAASIAYLRSVPIDSMINPATLNWKEINAQARERNVHDCPICIMPLARARGHLTLLSCSHVFHDTCIESFEHFNCETVHLCPVCRTMYHKTMYSTSSHVP